MIMQKSLILFFIFFVCNLYAMEQPDNQSKQFLGVIVDSKKLEKVHTYIGLGWDSFVKRQLDAGIPVNACNDTGYTILQTACDQSKHQVVALLLARGANPHLRPQYYNASTPLHSAISLHSNAPKVVALLLAYGADAAARGYDQATPLLRAVEIGAVQLVAIILAKAHFCALHTIDPNDKLEEIVTLFTNFRVMEAKKLLGMQDKHNQTPSSILKLKMQNLLKNKNLAKVDQELLKNYGDLIPLVNVDLLESNFREAIQADVREILLDWRKKHK